MLSILALVVVPLRRFENPTHRSGTRFRITRLMTWGMMVL
jgi:hypothetical protein